MADGYIQQPMEKNDRRYCVDTASQIPRRWIDDSLLNKARWPVFVYSWFVIGEVLLALIRLARLEQNI